MVPALWSLWAALQSRRRGEQHSTAREIAALLELSCVLACEQLCEQCVAAAVAWLGLVSYMPLATTIGAHAARAYGQSWDRFTLSQYRIDARRIAFVL